MPSRPPPPPLFGLSADAPVALEQVSITVTCAVCGIREPSADCDIRASFIVRGLSPTVVTAARPEQVRFDGARATAPHAIAAGETIHVELEASETLRTHVSRSDPYITSPMAARHPLLGDSRWVRQREDASLSMDLFASVAEIRGPVSIDASQTGRAMVWLGQRRVSSRTEVDAQRLWLGIQLALPSESDFPLQNGGPVLALGERSHLTGGDDGRFWLSLAYEFGIAEVVSVNLAFETNFQSIMQSVVIDVATPMALILPSVSAGIGVVARQLGPRAPDAALRLRIGVGLWVLGTAFDFDYWPATGEWTATTGARLSM